MSAIETHTLPAVKSSDPFADLESDFDGGATPARSLPAIERIENPTLVDVHAKGTRSNIARFPCRKCNGTGRYRGIQFHVGHNKCFTCKGTGKQKTDPVAAARRREAKEQRRAAESARLVEAWNVAHPTEAAWITSRLGKFSFADSLAVALVKFGRLTDGQLAAVHRCIEKDAAREKERTERKPDADVAGAGFARMIAAFDAAKVSGLRRPKFRVGDFEFAPAKATSANAGCIYVTCRGVYVGKITADGKFFASREATADNTAEVARIGADPLAAAVMHGKQTGNCSCCGRHLENAESVELGIGPICRAKWGLS